MNYIVKPNKNVSIRNMGCSGNCSGNCMAKCGSLGTCFCPLK